MSVNSKVLAGLLAGLCGIASAQTIDELSDLNRQAMIADAKAKLEKKKDTPPAVSGAPGMAGTPNGLIGAAMPTGIAISPQSALNRIPAGSKKAEKQQKPVAVPVLVAIYGVGGCLVTELADSGFEAKYREGDRTPSGWTVSRIDKRLVAMTRPQAKGAGFQTVSLPFGIKLDEHKEKEKEAAVTPGGGLSMPPLPPNFPMLTK